MVDVEKDFEEIRKLMDELGSNFDYLFSVLRSVNAGIKSEDSEYLAEKLDRLKDATDMIRRDVPIGIKRRKEKDVDAS